MANVETNKGSWMVISFCKQLKLLEKDVSVTEFQRRMAKDLSMQKAVGVLQTPQLSIFPHTETFLRKW